MTYSLGTWVLCICALVSGTASAQVAINFDAPTASQLVGDAVDLSVSVMGVASMVEASVGTHRTTLSKVGASSQYTGVLSILSEPSGTAKLTVTAYDGSNNPWTASQDIIIDRPPKLQVVTPVWGHVFRQANPVANAQCTDDGASCTVTSSVAPTVGRAGFTMSITAIDSQNQTTTTSVPIYIEPSAYLREVITAGAGDVLDFDGVRALVRSVDQHTASIWTSIGAPIPVYAGPEFVIAAELSQGGAVVTIDSSQSGAGTLPGQPPSAKVLLWDGVSSAVLPNAVKAHATGKWVAFATKVTGSTPDSQLWNLVLRDTTTGTDTWSTQNTFAEPWIIAEFEVGSNGDISWADGPPPRTLHWRHGGVIATAATTASEFSGISLDDSHVTYWASSRYKNATSLLSPTTSENLCELMSELHQCPPAFVNNGWVAYSVQTASDTVPASSYRVYRRSPAGGVEQFALDSAVYAVAISPSGELVAEGPGARYVGQTPSSAVQLSTNQGRVVYFGRWYVLMGRSVFEVDPAGTSPSDGGVDGGSGLADAGTRADGGSQSASDAGDRPADAGIAMDAGSDVTGNESGVLPRTDSGTDNIRVSSDCSVRVAQGRSGAELLFWLMGLLALTRRRSAR